MKKLNAKRILNWFFLFALLLQSCGGSGGGGGGSNTSSTGTPMVWDQAQVTWDHVDWQ